MAENAEVPESEYQRREREAGDFWVSYVDTVRQGADKPEDVPDEMQDALKEVFTKIDNAVAKAVETGYIFFRYRSAYEHQELTTLIFSNGQGKKLQRTLKIDCRFTMKGRPLHFHDYWWLRIALMSLVVNEGRVKPDPRGGWIPDAIIDNADKLKSEIQADRKGMLRLKLSVDPDKSEGR